MKKHLVCIAIVMMTVLFAGQAGANSITQNEFITAQSLDSGMTQAGVFFSLDKHYQSFYPAVRYGLGALFEIGGKVGAVTNMDPGNKNGAFVAVDLKYQFIKQTEGIPIDMAADIGFDTILVSRRNVSELKFSTIFSRGFTLMDRGYKFTPYGGLQVSALYGSFLHDDHVDFNAIAGLEWKISQKFMVLLELKGGTTLVGGVGVRFEF
jgi:hypothetical protein